MKIESPQNLIDVDAAQRVLFAHVRPLPMVELPLREAAYRTLAAPVICDVDYPPFERSIMDGYAVRAEDVAAAPVAATPVVLRLVGQIAAGTKALRTLGPREAMQINTGAPIPSGADAVVRLEETELRDRGETVWIKSGVTKGEFITPRGAFARAGKMVLESGSLLTPINIGVAATAGASRVTVYRHPRVALLATGDELVDVSERPEGARIRNSNQYMLEALMRAAHVEAVCLGIARDDQMELSAKITQGLTSDVLCITGGVSVGAFDFVPQVLRDLGARIIVEKIAIKPGRPVIVAIMPEGTLVFALPGNPISAWVGFELLLRPALAALQGSVPEASSLIAASLDGSLAATRDRRSYVPARARINDRGGWSVTPLNWHGSGDSIGAAQASALIMRPPRCAAAVRGETVLIHLTERM